MANFPVHKLLIASGISLVIVGIIWYFFSDKFSWIGKLPGDIRYESENSKFYFPITTMLLISAIINVIIWLAKRYI
ncbi:MAG: DUF2905 domain-containing protein [Sphingobacteriaceae bacterium]